jgi:outer membrane lipoprotein-sorting protein
LKKQIKLISILIFFLSVQFYSQTDDPITGGGAELEKILEKCAEYCERLKNVSLYFVCKEEIKEKVYTFPARSGSAALLRSGELRENNLPKNLYIYDYQLIRKGNSLDEQRILIEENGQEKNDLDAQLKTTRFHHKFIVFGPIGLLGQKQQKNYDYKILKNVNYKKEKAVILKALPKFPQENNTLYGKIWIRKKDFAILKIEWEQESLENFEEIEKIAKGMNATPLITFISEYGFEKNKIRFPNKYSVEEIYISRQGGSRFLRSKTTVVYDNYIFFTVVTDVKY